MDIQKENKGKKNVLGKGMAALLGPSIGQEIENKEKSIKKIDTSAPIEPATGSIKIPLSSIKANKDQPRKIFKEAEIKELSQSIAQNGIIQPLIVEEVDGGFQVIAGERRLRAAKLAGLKDVPVVVKKVTKKDSLLMAIIENVQRADLNCVEEALAYYQLMEEFNLTQEEVAKKVGKERSSIANFLRILKLPRDVISLLQKEILSFGHAKVLSGIKDREEIIRTANQAAAEGLSVRETENLIKKKKKTNKEKIKSNEFFDERLPALKDKLERQTGFHFDLNSKQNGAGLIKIKFSNEAEFNDIFEYLMR